MSHTVTLQASGKQFVVESGETVLEAARRAGLALPYSCQAGVCGSCKATLISGHCDYPRHPPSALNASERAQHAVLLCQAVPETDLSIAAREVASVADIPRRTLDLRVLRKDRLAPDVIRLDLHAPGGEKLRYLAGQYLNVVLDDGKRRPFSIANAPHDNTHIELHLRHVAGGGFTEYVFEQLAIGEVLRIEGPLGTFVPREDSERPMILMAGGTGFAPIKAIIEHFLHLGTRRAMHLYWGARNSGDLYLQALPQRWARELGNLSFQPVLSDPEPGEPLRRGLVHEAVLEDHPDLSGVDLYMSGPPALIDAGRQLFIQAGLAEERLYYDSFEYAPDVLAQILQSRAGIHDG